MPAVANSLTLSVAGPTLPLDMSFDLHSLCRDYRLRDSSCCSTLAANADVGPTLKALYAYSDEEKELTAAASAFASQHIAAKVETAHLEGERAQGTRGGALWERGREAEARVSLSNSSKRLKDVAGFPQNLVKETPTPKAIPGKKTPTAQVIDLVKMIKVWGGDDSFILCISGKNVPGTLTVLPNVGVKSRCTQTPERIRTIYLLLPRICGGLNEDLRLRTTSSRAQRPLGWADNFSTLHF
ncbi:hypothetical protein C8J57DRAFT_1233749 [Mycena rebaudengoi]|nr:hypothetical protein C8J57DRAFT_1233749 [Mycena rebaudengoi]